MKIKDVVILVGGLGTRLGNLTKKTFIERNTC